MAENTPNLTNEAENSNNSNKNNKRNMRYVFLIVVLCMLVGVFGIAAGYFSNYHDTVYEVDYADINGSSGYKALTSAVKGTFKEDGTKSYIKITFSSDAGTLAAGDTVQIQGRIHSESWGMYTQSNDASFLSDAEAYTLKNACRLVVK